MGHSVMCPAMSNIRYTGVAQYPILITSGAGGAGPAGGPGPMLRLLQTIQQR